MTDDSLNRATQRVNWNDPAVRWDNPDIGVYGRAVNRDAAALVRPTPWLPAGDTIQYQQLRIYPKAIANFGPADQRGRWQRYRVLLTGFTSVAPIDAPWEAWQLVPWLAGAEWFGVLWTHARVDWDGPTWLDYYITPDGSRFDHCNVGQITTPAQLTKASSTAREAMALLGTVLVPQSGRPPEPPLTAEAVRDAAVHWLRNHPALPKQNSANFTRLLNMEPSTFKKKIGHDLPGFWRQLQPELEHELRILLDTQKQ